MKRLSVMLVTIVVLFLAGCQDTAMLDCHDQNIALQVTINDLQAQLAQAQKDVNTKQTRIENLRAENIDMQTYAMESIATMLQRLSAADEKMKSQLAESRKQVKELQGLVESMKAEQENLKGLYENANKALEAAAQTGNTASVASL